MVSLNITKYFVNRGSSNEGELRMRVLSRKRKLSASILAFVVVAVMVFGLCLCPQSAGAAENTVADDLTVNKWHDSNALDDSTRNVGRIWTDKSVSTENVTLTGPGGEKDTKTIEKDTKSDFLVGLSALSSTASITGQSTVPLDIVLVLDVSGSMDDPSGGYTEVYQLNTRNTYYILRDRNYTEVKYSESDQSWYYDGFFGIRKNFVTPKASADDTDRRHYQFYEYKEQVQKLTTLKNAVNSFIDKSAQENDSRPDNLKSRISIVKFAGDTTDRVGNDTYRDGRYTYNYTQIVSNYKAYTSDDKSELQNKVNALRPAGATAADNAMDLAKTLVEQSKTEAENSSDRKNAKRVVIFFTDGEPNHSRGFDEDVANDAIASAKTIKSAAYIYTIGVFNGAKASDTTGSLNAYMHGMSSNYPDATAYNKLGTRAKDSKGDDTQYYKAAENAADLNNIFTEIGDEIASSAQSPTHVDQGEDPNQAGYITITDQLGDYMQVDDLNTLLYADQELTSGTKGYSKTETTEGNKKTVTYTFDYDIPDTNHVYPEGNLKDIVITVEKTTGEDQLHVGDLVTVKIPASLIPLRYYEIDKDGNMTIDETYPMRLFYDVSLKDGVAEKIENPDALLQAYINTNKDDEGHVHFYTNKYDKDSKDEASEGIGAYSYFKPATTNDFYYFQNNTFLYTDEACTKPATGAIDTSGETIYYYQRDYYELKDGKAEKKINTVTIPGNSNLLLSGFAEKDTKTGQYYIPAGTPRTTSLTYFTENKADGANKTDTAKTSIKPVWGNDFRGNSITTYLGNNGRMTLDLPGQLDLSKTVKAETGHAVPDSLKEQAFKYKLELTAKEGSELKIGYTAQKYNGAKADGDSFKIKPGDTFTLKDGQTLKIYGLAPGTEYTVTETKADHFTAAVAQDNAGDNAKTGKDNNGGVFAKGTIPGNDVASAAFTNTYKADPATLDGAANLKVKKEFQLADGTSAWEMEYLKDSQFTFLLTANSDNAPLPEDAVEIAGIKAARVTVTDKNDINKAFGNITFTEPGTYKYRIAEQDPRENGKQGVVYSRATYMVTVTVIDENGTLNAVAEMKNTRDDNGTELATATVTADKTATFKNVYDADSESVAIRAAKNFTDHTGSRLLEDGQYTFRITPKTPGAPLPEGDSEYTETTNTGVGVVFKSCTFTAKDAQGATQDNPKRYEYTMEEVLPQGANETNHYTVNGITYDPAKYTIQLDIYIQKVDGKDTVVVDRIYLNAEGTVVEVPVFRNSYKADPVTLTGETALKGDKTLTGRDMLSGETFDFTLTAGDDTTKKALEDKVITIAANGDRASVSGGTNKEPTSFNFGDVAFTKEGTYTFDIKETVPAQKAGGMTYDRHTAKVTVVVTDDGNGQLTAAVSYDNGTVSDKTDKAVFKNKYEASHAYSTSGGLDVEKVLTGRTMKAGEFTFTITPAEGAPAISDSDKSFTNTRKGSGIVDVMQKLQGLVFTEADAGKTYIYTVAETAGDLIGVTYDDTEYTVAIKVVDNGDGTMHTVTTIRWKDADGIDKEAVYNSSDADAGTPTVRFNNSYKAADADPVDITEGFQKVLKGREWKDSDSFTFTLRALTDGAPMPEKSEVTVSKDNLADGKAPVSFGNITFTKAGVYEYEVKEQDPGDSGAAGVKYDTAARIITVTVTDNENGQLVAVVTAVEGSRTFTNKYETENLPLDEVCAISMTKVLYGHDMAQGQFEFTIKAKDKASADKMNISLDEGAVFGNPAANDSEVSTLIDSLGMTLTQEDIGKTYTYTLAETKGSDKGYVYDENQYKLEITTIDNGDGTLKANVVLTNTTTGEKIFNKTVSKEELAAGQESITIGFENRYDGSTDVDGGTKADVKANKTLTGRSLKADEFTFMLATKPADGSEGRVLQTVKNNGSGNIAFSSLSYKTLDEAAGENAVILSDAVREGYAVKSVDNDGRTVYTLSYRVYEDSSALPGGVSMTSGTFDFTVTVTDNGDGTLTAVTNYPDGKSKFGFVNQYGTDDVDVNVTGSKTLSHAEGLTPNDITGKFTFTITALTDGAPMPDNTTAKNDAAGNVNFGKTTFKLSDLENVAPAADGSRTKVFEYKVTEAGSAAGVTNDPDAVTGKTFTITLTDDGNGNLTATKDPAQGPAFTFTNTYTVGELPSSITDQISIDKDLTGRDLRDGEFSFELLEGGEVIATGSNDAKGKVTFSRITYTEPGAHTYTVREVKGTAGGVTYDDQLYTVYTTISDNGDGTLSAKHQVIAMITDNEAVPAEKNAITFSNSYKADPTSVTIGAVKKLEGKALEAGQFTFQLKDADGKVIAEAKNDKTGAVMFDTVKFKEAGVYEYTVSEVNDKQANIKYDEHVYKIKVTVTDDGSGTLSAEVSDDSIVFTNHYTPAGTGTDTGDDSSMAVALGLMMMAATAGGAVLVRRKINQ